LITICSREQKKYRFIIQPFGWSERGSVVLKKMFQMIRRNEASQGILYPISEQVGFDSEKTT